MSIDSKGTVGAAPPCLGRAGTLARLSLIAVTLAAVAGTFAYLGGWLTPNELTPARFTDAFEQVDGTHPGFRGGGFADYVEVAPGTAVDQFFAERLPGRTPADYLIRVNRLRMSTTGCSVPAWIGSAPPWPAGRSALKRAFTATLKHQQRIVRLERQLARMEEPA